MDYYYVCYDDSISARVSAEIGINLVKKATLWYFYGSGNDYRNLLELIHDYHIKG